MDSVRRRTKYTEAQGGAGAAFGAVVGLVPFVLPARRVGRVVAGRRLRAADDG